MNRGLLRRTSSRPLLLLILLQCMDANAWVGCVDLLYPTEHATSLEAGVLSFWLALP